MDQFVSRTSRVAALVLLGTAMTVSPAIAQKAAFTEDFDTMRSKFNSLAGAMEADTYGWQPMDGVRTVSEVYMLIAAEAYYMPSVWGADPPEGIEISNDMFNGLAEVTNKEAVLGHLETSFTHASEALADLSDDKMGEEIPFFGQTRTITDAIYILLTDMHEHLGQAIAYARSNHVVPPWSADSG